VSRRRGTAGHAGAQKGLRQRREEAQRQADDDLRAVLATREGRSVVWRIIDGMAGTFGATFTGSSQTFHLEGRRSVGIDLMRESQRVAPDSYVLALTEALEERRLERDHTSHSESVAQGDDDS